MKKLVIVLVFAFSLLMLLNLTYALTFERTWTSANAPLPFEMDHGLTLTINFNAPELAGNTEMQCLFDVVTDGFGGRVCTTIPNACGTPANPSMAGSTGSYNNAPQDKEYSDIYLNLVRIGRTQDTQCNYWPQYRLGFLNGIACPGAPTPIGCPAGYDNSYICIGNQESITSLNLGNTTVKRLGNTIHFNGPLNGNSHLIEQIHMTCTTVEQSCTDECTVGTHQCVDSNTKKDCIADPDGSYDGDTCADWRSSDCSGSTPVCNNGACVPAACIPKTCATLDKECGTWSDTCGGTVTCGSSGHCSDSGEYCTTTGECTEKPAVQGEGLTCAHAQGNLVDTNGIITGSINLKAYKAPTTLLGQANSQPLSSGGAFNISYATPYTSGSHTFILKATNLPNANPNEGSEIEIARKTLVCESAPTPSCEIENINWQISCIGAGNEVPFIVKADTTCDTTTNDIIFKVYEDDINSDDEAETNPENKKIPAGKNSITNTWTAEWQQDQFSQNPSYYINATLDGKTITSKGKANGTIEVRYCNKNIDEDCDSVRDEHDACHGTAPCVPVNSRGCDSSSSEGQCEALWDCSNAGWTECTNGKITRDICEDSSAGNCCQGWDGTQPNNCKCEFLGDINDFNNCAGTFALDNERVCLTEEAFPVFGWTQLFIAIILICGFYFFKKKSLKEH